VRREADAQRASAGRVGKEHAAAAAVRGLSQEAQAHDSEVNRTCSSAAERSERNVSIDNIARIAKGLGVEPWKMLKDD
jgi:hypothetical protein